MIYEGTLNFETYPDDKYTIEVFKELSNISNMKLSFLPLYNHKTLEIWTFKINKETGLYKLIERYVPSKFNIAKFSPLACAIFIKALTEYKMELYD